MIAPPPTHTSEPMSTGFPNSWLATQPGVERVHRRVDLHCRAEEREAADTHRAHVQDDAVEVEEDALPELDVRAVVAEERRLHPHGVAAAAEQLAQDSPPLLLLCLARGVQRLTEVACTFAGRGQLRIQRVVQLSREHLLALTRHW